MIRARYEMKDLYELYVADAVADHAPARAKAAVVARKVAAQSQVNLRTANVTTKRAKELQQQTLARIGVKDAGRVFRREKTYPPGSKIPVFLVVSNFFASKWFEFGYGTRGRSFPATYFMAQAMRSAKTGGIVYYGRGKR